MAEGDSLPEENGEPVEVLKAMKNLSSVMEMKEIRVPLWIVVLWKVILIQLSKA